MPTRGIFVVLIGLAACSCGTSTHAPSDGGSAGLGGTGGDTGVTVSGPQERITGRVFDLSGVPFGDVTIFVTGIDPVLADATGQFAIDKVPSSYDLAVVATDCNAVVVWKGLTRRDPVLTVPDQACSSHSPALTKAYAATLGGTLTPGAGAAFADGDVVYVWADGPDLEDAYVEYGPIQAGVTYGYADLSLAWSGPSSEPATVQALQVVVGSQPAAYAYGSAATIVASNAPGNITVDLTLAPLPTGSLSGNVELPSGYALDWSALYMRTAATELPLAGSCYGRSDCSGSGTSFAFTTPLISGATALIGVGASNAQGGTVELYRYGVPLDASVALAPPTAPALISPAAGAVTITQDSTFSWDSTAGSVYQLSILPADPESQAPRYHMITREATMTLSDFAPFGLSFPGATAYAWSVESIAPADNVDALTVEDPFAAASEVTFATSGQLGFTFSATP